MNEPRPQPFYRDGLRFSCTRCSLCCRFDSGFVWLSRADLSVLAAHFGVSVEETVARYCRTVDIGGFRQLSLREQENKDCVFWLDGACSVYASRPLQCRTYPFWAHQLTDRETWNETARTCPGIDLGAQRGQREIEEMVENRRVEPPLNADSLER